MFTTDTPRQAAQLLDRALRLVRARHEPADLAHAALAGLRLVRSTIDSQAGYGAMREFDDWLRGRLDERGRRRLPGRPVHPPPLPDLSPRAGTGAVRASIIVCDAVHTCMFLNAATPQNSLLLLASERLLDALCEGAGGAPSWPRLSDALGAGSGEIGYEPQQPEGTSRVQ